MWTIKAEKGYLSRYISTDFTPNIYDARFFLNYKEASDFLGTNSISHPPLSDLKTAKILEIELITKTEEPQKEKQETELLEFLKEALTTIFNSKESHTLSFTIKKENCITKLLIKNEYLKGEEN